MSPDAVMLPAVSVIVAVYNGEKYVVAALDSIRAQTCADWQLIVVDDGSTDGTPAVLAQYPADPRIEIVRQENRGLAAARNRGQARCSAPYIAFLDADDMWLPTYLAEMVRELIANPAAVAAFAGWQYVDEAGHPLPQAIIPSRALGRRLGEELLWRNPLVPSGVVVCRWALEACLGFDMDFIQAHDWDLWLRLLALGPFVAVPKRLVWYRTHGENMSEDLAVAEADWLKVLRRHLHVERDPTAWTDPQRQAIGHTLFVSALAYFRRGKVAAGVAKTQEALRTWPAMTARDETYYELGCAYQQRGWRGSGSDLRLDQSTHLIRTLIFEHWPAPSEAARHAWWRHACLVLSQLAYEAGDRLAARRLAAQAWRGAARGQKGRALRAILRAGLPGRLVQWVRRVRRGSMVSAE